MADHCFDKKWRSAQDIFEEWVARRARHVRSNSDSKDTRTEEETPAIRQQGEIHINPKTTYIRPPDIMSEYNNKSNLAKKNTF